MGTTNSRLAGKAAAAVKNAAGTASHDVGAGAVSASRTTPSTAAGAVIDSAASFTAATTANTATSRSYEYVMRRVNQRPAMFRRLDDTGEADATASPPGAQNQEGSGTDAGLTSGPSVADMLPTRDREAAEVAHATMRQLYAEMASAGAETSAPESSSERCSIAQPGGPDRPGDTLSPSHADAPSLELRSAPGFVDEAAELHPIQREAGAASALDPTAVSVRRVRPSRFIDDDAAAALHERNPATVANVDALAEREGLELESGPDRQSAGAVSFQIYEAMQLNPRLLDTAAALASSPAQLIAAQMAAGMVPLSARGEVLLLPAGSTADDLATPVSNGGAAGCSGADDAVGGDGGSAARRSDSLVVRVQAAEALVPAHATVDQLLLATEPQLPSGMTAWAPRPPDASAYDQLILHPEDEDFALERGEVFELYARHKADPVYWSPRRLADKYDTKVEWVEVLLAYASPPLYAQVDGEAYGVYEIRSYEDLHARNAAVTAAGQAAEAAEAAGRAQEADEAEKGSNGEPPLR